MPRKLPLRMNDLRMAMNTRVRCRPFSAASSSDPVALVTQEILR
jgi:hypothetical protein